MSESPAKRPSRRKQPAAAEPVPAAEPVQPVQVAMRAVVVREGQYDAQGRYVGPHSAHLAHGPVDPNTATEAEMLARARNAATTVRAALLAAENDRKNGPRPAVIKALT